MPVYVFLNLSAGLSIQPSIHPSVCLPISPTIPCITSFCPSVHPLVYPFFSLHVHLSLLLFIPLSNHLSVQLSMHTMHSIFLSIQSVHPLVHPSISLYVIFPSFHSSLCLSICRSNCPSVHPSTHLYISLSIYLSINQFCPSFFLSSMPV